MSQVSGSSSEWHPAMQSDVIRSREPGTLLCGGGEDCGLFIQLLSLRLLYGDVISYDVIGLPLLSCACSHLIQLYFLSVKKAQTLSGPQINKGPGLFIIHCKGFFHLALTKVTLVPPCQNLFATFIHLSCFQGVTGTLHSSFLSLTIYAVLPLDEPSVKFSRISFKESLAITLAKYSCANSSSNQLGKDY